MNDKKMYRTDNRGESWNTITLPADPIALTRESLEFHALRSPYLIFTGKKCSNSFGFESCFNQAWYSTDDGNSWKELRSFVKRCMWGQSTAEFMTLPVQAIFCSEWQDKDEQKPVRSSEDLTLAYTEDFFHSTSTITFDENQQTGVVGFGTVNRFLVVAVKPKSHADLDLYVSTDGHAFFNSQFPFGTGIKEDAYTVLESSRDGLVVDVFSSRGYNKEYGSLYRSDSTGRYFVKSIEATNRNSAGIVDYEKVQGVEGIILSNIVSNPSALTGQFPEAKRVESRISFDNGATWRFINPPTYDTNGRAFSCDDGRSQVPNEKCALHLHSITSPHNRGYVFSDAGVPGVIIGVGNVGDYLLPYEDCDTYLSTDGGLSWKMVRRNAHKYESADMGGVLVLIDDEQPSDYVMYSTDFGQHWNEYKFGKTIRAKMMMSDPESTSQHVLIMGSEPHMADKFHAIAIDFSQVFDRKCSDNDFEKWHARPLNADSECLMGHHQFIQRRLPSAECYVGRDYKKPEVEKKPCACSAENFECDFGYIPDKDDPRKCKLVGKEIIPDGSCINGATTYEGSSGYRRIPGDTCSGGEELDKLVKKECKSVDNSGQIKTSVTHLSSRVAAKYYIPKSSVILLKDSQGVMWRSDNEGASFSKISIEAKGVMSESFYAVSVYLHDTAHERLYFFMSDDRLYYSSDFGAHFSEITLPMAPNHIGVPYLDFHPTERDWLIFVGGTKCPNCKTEAFVSQDNGRSWGAKFDDYVQKCVFSQDKEFTNVEKDAIFCSAYANKFGSQDSWNGMPTTPSGNHLVLYKYDQLGRGSRSALADRVVQFYVYERFLAVATEDHSGVKLSVSTDGRSLADVQFPPDVKLDKNAFTIVQSNTGSIFLDVAQNTKVGSEFGELFHSNSNGTFYTQSLKDANININGLVDFEQVQGVDGILVANVVVNPSDARAGHGKRVQSRISFNDGGSWQQISPPERDYQGKSYNCYQPGCQLNLHGRSEISWAGPIFSADTAQGLMMGVGNVGPHLSEYSESNTYLSRDGGLTWKEVRKGPHLFEFGNRGALLVMVSDSEMTNKLLYSWDHGSTWAEYKFYETPIRVSALTIEPTASSSKFILFGFTQQSLQKRDVFGAISDFLRIFIGSVSGATSLSQVAVQVDLSGLSSSECVFRQDGTGDFEKWNPSQTDCILGQEWTYWRRKSDRKCRIPKDLELPTEKRTCECTKDDYECDTGFWRNSRGECELAGRDYLEPAGCKQGEEYSGRSGYRKISMTKCTGRVARYEDSVTRKCSGRSQDGGPIAMPPSNGNAGVYIGEFDSQIDQVIWFEKSNNALLRSSSNLIYQTRDGGATWKKAEVNGPVPQMIQNPYFPERVYLMSTTTSFHYVSTDKGVSINLFKTPSVPNSFNAPLLEFHAEEPDWIIFVGNQDCPGENCRTVAFYTQDNGQNWHEMMSYARDCEWARDAKFKNVEKTVVMCDSYAEQSGNMNHKMSRQESRVLRRSADFFSSSSEIVATDVIGFAVSENFMVAAITPGGDRTRFRFLVSIDGERFAEAVFPPGTDASTNAFTVLEAASGTIFLDMAQSSNYRQEHGKLFISNWNGTYYTLGLDGTNRSPDGYVDYERMLGLEGLALMNQISNLAGMKAGEAKKVRTLMTYDDGLYWRPLKAPNMDSQGRPYDCVRDPENCHLHLQGFTQRRLIKNEMSDPSAVGIFIGVGNVGSALSSYEQSNTYLTTNAGKDWIEVKKGPHLFEFGDHGSVIVLVHAREAVNYVWYSVTEGASFQKYEFSPSMKLYADRFVTDPSGTKQSFILVGRDASSQKGASVTLDFSKMRQTKCRHDKEDPGRSDFELWSVADQTNNTCVFGHITQYYRRKIGRDCYIGEEFENLPQKVENCQCAESDYECDSGYFRDENNKCVIMSGLTEVWSECTNGMSYLSSGYRKHAMSTCIGGLKLDTPVRTQYCAFGVGSVAGTWIIVTIITLLVAGGLGFGYYMYQKRYSGRIRLPTSDDEESGGTSSRLKWPVSFDAASDFFRTIFRQPRRPRRSNYRRVSANDLNVFVENYETE